MTCLLVICCCCVASFLPGVHQHGSCLWHGIIQCNDAYTCNSHIAYALFGVSQWMEGAWAAKRPGVGRSVLTVPNELMLPHLHVLLMVCVNYVLLNCSACVHNAHCAVMPMSGKAC